MLKEYALRFYVLLNQSMRIDAEEWLEQANAASAPYMEDRDRTSLMDSYKNRSHDIIEDIREGQSLEGTETLKELM